MSNEQNRVRMAEQVAIWVAVPKTWPIRTLAQAAASQERTHP